MAVTAAQHVHNNRAAAREGPHLVSLLQSVCLQASRKIEDDIIQLPVSRQEEQEGKRCS